MKKKNIVSETVQDYSKFNKDNFCDLITNIDWHLFDVELNPVVQWQFIDSKITDILAINVSV